MMREKIRPPQLSETEESIKKLGSEAVGIGSRLLQIPDAQTVRVLAERLRRMADQLAAMSPSKE